MQLINVGVTFLRQLSERVGEFALMLREYFTRHDAPRALLILPNAQRKRHVQHDGDDWLIRCAGKLQQRRAGLRLQVGCVNHRELALCEPQARQMMEQLKSGGVDGLIVFIVANQRAALIGRNDFGELKMTARERAFARARRAEQENQGWVRQVKFEQIKNVKPPRRSSPQRRRVQPARCASRVRRVSL